MIQKPPYFEDVRRREEHTWNRADPRSMAPSLQLFSQLDNPQYVISELLQNADDAGATQARAWVENHTFTFEHDGLDFTRENFESLCGFGYSDKRLLSTTGFRGMGFKSVFSLGDVVELNTRSLSVSFHKDRFTLPVWMDGAGGSGTTRIRVRVSDEGRLGAVLASMKEWLQTPTPMIFFSSIRRMGIGDEWIRREALEPGPTPGSQWMSVNGRRMLSVRSAPEDFPGDALENIRSERTMGLGGEMKVPQCRTELILGDPGRIYAVLPTGMKTGLPFACNAPFILNPDRLMIKNPAVSPANRWLLDRLGTLAASAMLSWLQSGGNAAERAKAYDIFPDVVQDDATPDGICCSMVVDAFRNALNGQKVLLADDGRLVGEGEGVAIPGKIRNVWPPDITRSLLAGGMPAISGHITQANLKKLVKSGLAREAARDTLLETLQRERPPKPNSWDGLLDLWSYVASGWAGPRRDPNAAKLRIFPVLNGDALHAGNKVIRPDLDRAELEFLSGFVPVVDPDWLRFILEKQEADDQDAGKAHLALERTGQDRPTPNAILLSVAGDSCKSTQDRIRLAHIGARLRAFVPEGFPYVSWNLNTIYKDDEVLFDAGGLERLIPEERRGSLLHQDYSRFVSCSRDEWNRWIASPKSGIRTFPVPQEYSITTDGAPDVTEMQRRGLECEPSGDKHILNDWDFGDSYWDHWEALAASDNSVWADIVKRLSPEVVRMVAGLSRIKDGQTVQVSHSLRPTWALKLGERRCLPDTRGHPQRPADLMRRTPQTEPLVSMGAFVDMELDREDLRPLLDALGVRTVPDPAVPLERLRRMAAGGPGDARAHECYVALDLMLTVCTEDKIQMMRDVLQSERVVLVEDGSWVTAGETFREPGDEAIPARTIPAPVRDLALWGIVGVSASPADAVVWLKDMPRGMVSDADLRRIRGVLGRHPRRIWEECGHWLSLAGRWEPIENMRYRMADSRSAGRDLYEWVRALTADLRQLGEAANAPPFSELPRLEECMGRRLSGDPSTVGAPVEIPWLRTLGARLCGLDAEKYGEHDRSLARRLSGTVWQDAARIFTVPILEGRPASSTREAPVAWEGNTLYVQRLSAPKLARLVPEEIGRVFDHQDIRAAVHYCFDRPAKHVYEYVEANFSLDPDPTNDMPETDGEATSGETGVGAGGKREKMADTIDNAAPHGETGVGAGGKREDAPGTVAARYTGKGGVKPRQDPLAAESPRERSSGVRHDASAPDTATMRKTGRVGETYVMECERRRARECDREPPRDVSGDNCGYDIETFDRHIEVKSFAGTGAVRLTENEWETAKRLGDTYWLYVVERVLDEPRISLQCRNPFREYADAVRPTSRTIREYVIQEWRKFLPQ